jgi:signal transduction histidine kinase
MVDDDVSSTCLMANFLNRIGYTELQSINDSTRVFQTIETFAPDLILLDLAMPGLSGFEILNALRSDRQNEQIPVLVLTGDPSAKNKRRALAAGATDLLVKPFDASEMSMRIRSLLQAHFLRLEIQDQNRLLEERVRERTSELESALSDLNAAQREAGKAVAFETDLADPATVSGIGAELREVLTNLICNAMDAIPGDGLVTLRTRSQGDEAIAEVIDTGAGMTPEVRERCLEPFFTTKGDHGTGLGLAMVFGIIKRHQGTLEIESEAGKGTTVRIRLPVFAPPPENQKGPVPQLGL